MEEQIKTEIRYRCPNCQSTISERAMQALRDAHEASYYNCLHCRQAAFSHFGRVQYVDVLVWDDAGVLAFDQCSFEVRLLGDEPKGKTVRRTAQGWEVQMPDGSWQRKDAMTLGEFVSIKRTSGENAALLDEYLALHRSSEKASYAHFERHYSLFKARISDLRGQASIAPDGNLVHAQGDVVDESQPGTPIDASI